LLETRSLFAQPAPLRVFARANLLVARDEALLTGAVSVRFLRRRAKHQGRGAHAARRCCCCRCCCYRCCCHGTAAAAGAAATVAVATVLLLLPVLLLPLLLPRYCCCCRTAVLLLPRGAGCLASRRVLQAKERGGWGFELLPKLGVIFEKCRDC
jgi:hypothetical protein